MHPEIEELRPKLKEILYDCAVQIRATKAALYLYQHEGNHFELVTEYGFRGTARPKLDSDDPIIDRCGRGRSPYFINGLTAEPRFSEFLYEASTDRLLAAPIYSRGQLVGVIDMRDKAGKQPFEQPDVPVALAIADRVVSAVADRNLFGQRFIVLSEADRSGAHNAPVPVFEPKPVTAALGSQLSAVRPETAPQRSLASESRELRAESCILEAKAAMTRILISPAPPTLTEEMLSAVREVLRSMLFIPGAVVATFSAYGHAGGVQETAARGPLLPETLAQLRSKLDLWLSRRGEAGGTLQPRVHASGLEPPVTPEHLRKVFIAPVVAGPLRGLYLTVAFSGEPDRIGHELLTVFLRQVQLVLEEASNRIALTASRTRAAETLLEPDFTRYRRLRRHGQEVAAVAERFAASLGLRSDEQDDVKVVAIAHDAGMRLLDYERLYLKRDLTPEERDLLRNHPSVGAAIAEPLLGREAARAILCHHERVDGRGYPNGLQGDEIPLVSRIVQICDAWVAMIDVESYQPASSPEAAMSILASHAGTQFDGDLAMKFVEMVKRG